MRRVPRADRIAPRRRSAWLFGLAALVVAGAIGAALFGLPVRTWFEQDHQLEGLEYELGELQTVNNDLQSEVDALQTDDGIIRAAREELGHIQAGDRRDTMMPLPPLPRDLPDGWPYSQVDSILTVREAADAAAAAAPAGTAEPSGDGGIWMDSPTATAAAPTAAPTSVAAVPAAGEATSVPAVTTTTSIPTTTTTSP